MSLLNSEEIKRPQVYESLCIKKIYNFIYRLSGSTKVADVATEEVLLRQADYFDEILLLKQAWGYFLKRYGSCAFKAEEPIQQYLLALPSELRCSLILRDILGFSYKQTAFVIGKTEPEVTRLISEGRWKIKKRSAIPNIYS